MTAQKLVFSNEPKGWILDLTAKWVEYYQPKSPGRGGGQGHASGA